MKKLSLFIALIIMASCQVSAQEDGDYRRSFNLEDFDAIDVGGSFKVKIRQGQNYSVEFKAEKEKDLESLEVEVNGHELNIGFESDWSLFGNSSNHGNITVYITMPALESLDVSGAAKLYLYEFKNIENLEVDISGAAHAKLDIDAHNVEVDASGASQIEMIGWVDQLDLEVSGASHFKAKGTDIGRAKVDASGASHASFGKVESLDSETSGASHVSRD